MSQTTTSYETPVYDDAGKQTGKITTVDTFTMNGDNGRISTPSSGKNAGLLAGLMALVAIAFGGKQKETAIPEIASNPNTALKTGTVEAEKPITKTEMKPLPGTKPMEGKFVAMVKAREAEAAARGYKGGFVAMLNEQGYKPKMLLAGQTFVSAVAVGKGGGAGRSMGGSARSAA